MPSAPQARFDPDLPRWLHQCHIALVLSTYRANRLLFVGTDEQARLRLQERLYDRPMGLYAAGGSLWMAGRSHLWRFDDLLGPGQRHEGADRLYVPAASFLTGEVNAHELVLSGSGEPLFVNTLFSCLAALEPGSSFRPLWQPPFIDALRAEDRCHLNGVALRDGEPTWATACCSGNTAASWRQDRGGGGVVIHIPSGAIQARGLSMPHSPRWHQDRLWLLNSGTGELGWIEQEAFRPLCALPGFVRGLAFAAGCAVVGLSKLRSPQFTGLPLEERLLVEGQQEGICGLRVIDLSSGAVLHSLDLPEPIDELFDLVVLEGARQPQALGLLDEQIDCLVKLPEQPDLVRIRPGRPSGSPHQGEVVPRLGLPQPSQPPQPQSPQPQSPQPQPPQLPRSEQPPLPPEPGPPEPLPLQAGETLRFQRVFHLTPATLAPYASLTHPSLAPGTAALKAVQGELLAVSAMAGGVMVGLAIAERQGESAAAVLSLMVEAAWRGRGIGSRLLQHLMVFVAAEGLTSLSIRYQAPRDRPTPLDRLLPRLGWATPQQQFLLLEWQAEDGARIPWPERVPLPAGYRLVPWRAEYRAAAEALGAAPDLQRALGSALAAPEVSLALLAGEAVVGWLIVDRTGPAATRYSSLFVAPGHRARGQALCLLVEGFRRQAAAGIPLARAAVAPQSQGMLRLVERHLSAFPCRISSVRVSGIALRDAGAARA